MDVLHLRIIKFNHFLLTKTHRCENKSALGCLIDSQPLKEKDVLYIKRKRMKKSQQVTCAVGRNRWSAETSPVPSCCRVEGAHNKSPQRPGRGSRIIPCFPLLSKGWMERFANQGPLTHYQSSRVAASSSLLACHRYGGEKDV